MKHDRYIELVNREISGEITPQEAAELRRYLEEDPEARKMRRELHKTSELLGGVEDVEPPAYLKHHIMNSVDFSRYRSRKRRPVIELLGRARRLGLRPRLAYAFVAGVAVGLVLFSVFLPGSLENRYPDLSDLYATIGMTKSVGFSPTEHLNLDLPEAKGRVDLMRSADLLILEFSVRSPREFEVRLLYDPAEARFNGLRPEVGWESLTQVGDGLVSISGSGEGRFHLSLTKVTESALPIDFELLVSNQVVLSHTFEIGSGDEQKE
jgi:hypothetical protein